jgi:hypothetical protein
MLLVFRLDDDVAIETALSCISDLFTKARQLEPHKAKRFRREELLINLNLGRRQNIFCQELFQQACSVLNTKVDSPNHLLYPFSCRRQSIQIEALIFKAIHQNSLDITNILSSSFEMAVEAFVIHRCGTSWFILVYTALWFSKLAGTKEPLERALSLIGHLKYNRLVKGVLLWELFLRTETQSKASLFDAAVSCFRKAEIRETHSTTHEESIPSPKVHLALLQYEYRRCKNIITEDNTRIAETLLNGADWHLLTAPPHHSILGAYLAREWWIQKAIVAILTLLPDQNSYPNTFKEFLKTRPNWTSFELPTTIQERIKNLPIIDWEQYSDCLSSDGE